MTLASATSSRTDISATPTASPPFTDRPTAHVVAIIGGAPSALSEYARIRLPYVPEVIAINSAAEHVEADHLVSGHANLVEKMRGNAKGNPTTHTIAVGQGIAPSKIQADHVWHGIRSGGSSGLVATRIAKAMGFETVVLCGVPLEPCGYFDGYRKYEPQGGRILNLNHHPQILQDWRAHWAWAHEAGELEGVWSLSGWTRELLGNGQF